VIFRELKTRITLEPGYELRTDGKWIHHTTPSIDFVMKAEEGRLDDSLGNFQRSLPRDWIEGKPKLELEPKPEPRPKPEPVHEAYSDPLEEKLALLFGNKPDWAAFGFSSKPSLREFNKAYRKRSLEMHPDRGGNQKEFAKMQHQAEQCLKALKRPRS
jgi:hypothetical protein